MRRCIYCGRWFKNKQAVRAHLRHCDEYRATQSKRLQSGEDVPDLHRAIPDGNKLRFHPNAQIYGLWRDVLNPDEVRHQYCPEYAGCGAPVTVASRKEWKND